MENKTFDFSLSEKSLKDIPFGMYENNFTFYVDGKPYKTNRFIADLLSPYVRQLHYTDKSIDEFYINIKEETAQNNQSEATKKREEEDFFLDFLKLASFEDIKIDLKRQQRFMNYFYALGNFDEFYLIQPDFFEEINEDNAIDRLILLTNNKNIRLTSNLRLTESINNIITFISSHFESIDKEKMKQLHPNIIESIISNKSLKLQEEDTLLGFILEMYEKDRTTSPLFEYVLFNNVSKDMIETFLQEFDINDINNGIWKSFSKGIFSASLNDTSRYTEDRLAMVFEHDRGKEFEGIMKYLTNETGGNIHDNGTIEITSNSICNNSISNHPKNLVDYQNASSYYHSADKEGHAYIRFDFRDKLVNLSSYTIKSNNNGTSSTSWNLKSWVMEVSNDCQKWEEVDRHENDSTLNGANIIHTFDIQKPSNNFYRYVQLRQTGDSWSSPNDKRFWFYLIEFYGKLKNPANKTN